MLTRSDYINPDQAALNAYSYMNGGSLPNAPTSQNSGNAWWSGNLGRMTAPPTAAQGAANAANVTSALSPYLNAGMPQMPAIKQPQLSQNALNYPTFLQNLGEQTSQEAFQHALNVGAPSPQTLMHAQDQLNSNRLNYMGQAGQAQLGVDKVNNDFLDSWNQLLTQIYGVQAGMRGQDLSFINGRLSSTMAGRGGVTSIGGTRNAIGGGTSSGQRLDMNGNPMIGGAVGPYGPQIPYNNTNDLSEGFSPFVSQGFQSGWT